MRFWIARDLAIGMEFHKQGTNTSVWTSPYRPYSGFRENATPLKYIVTLYLYNRKKNSKFNQRAKRVAKKKTEK